MTHRTFHPYFWTATTILLATPGLAGCWRTAGAGPAPDEAFESLEADSGGGKAAGELAWHRRRSKHCGPAAPVAIPNVPAALAVPASATLVAAYYAAGTQNYACTPSSADAGVARSWIFKGPSATLYDAHCRVAGTHYEGPTWKSSDGSAVVGSKVAASESPNPASVPTLLLKASSNAGSGGFGSVTFLQRLATRGGLAPAGECATEGAELAVPYEATYYFYEGGK